MSMLLACTSAILHRCHPVRLRFFAVLALPLRLSAQHTRYKLIDIGTLGGPNSSPPFSFFVRGITEALSSAGTFAGQADTATPDPFAPNCFGDCFVSHAIQWRR